MMKFIKEHLIKIIVGVVVTIITFGLIRKFKD